MKERVKDLLRPIKWRFFPPPDPLSRPASSDPPEIEQILTSFSGGVAYDVGANHWHTAHLLADHFDWVYAFEPALENARFIRGLPPNVTPLMLAVSDNKFVELAEVGFYMSGDMLVHSSHAAVTTRKVASARLSQLTEALPEPDFIKIDVEGHEGNVIDGGFDMLARVRPNLFIEVHSEELGRRITSRLSAIYPHLDEVRHPSYPTDDQAWQEHYWLVAHR